MPEAVDTVVWAPDDGWRYHPKHVEQFTDINKLYIVSSCWTIIDKSNTNPARWIQYKLCGELCGMAHLIYLHKSEMGTSIFDHLFLLHLCITHWFCHRAWFRTPMNRGFDGLSINQWIKGPPKVSLLWRSGGACVVTWSQELCWL
jgi:hypothetical protein